MNFQECLNKKSAEVETYLADCLTQFTMPGGLRKAMNYSLLAGGKRLRPILCLEFASFFGLSSGAVMPFAAAIECIHSYSLVHDDLPAMDNDDLRRGKPSNHKMFGEATAILAGDSLLTDAFTLMASIGLNSAIRPDLTLKALHTLALAAGSSGMAGGQYLDMLYTEQSAKGIKMGLEELKKMQAAKTGALIRASCECGAILAGASESEVALAKNYGLNLGLAFQIVDDILDEVGDEALLGKPVGSDAAQGKLTYPALVGLEESRKLAAQAGDTALRALSGFADDATYFLRGLVSYVLKRAS